MVDKISMLLGSLDHSPSEQLEDDLTRWHTTALVLSEGGEHWQQLPSDLANRISGNRNLRRWSGRNLAKYKLGFEKEFGDCLSDHPVHVRVLSAQGSAIKDFFPTIISDLGISDRVQRLTVGSKDHLKFGPFMRGKYGTNPELWTCQLPERQAIPLLFICHFLLRTHHSVMSMMKIEQPDIDWIDWQLMHNKFPGDVHGPMGSLFGAIMTGATHAGAISGNMLIGTFNDPRQDHGNLLADNIAGLFSDKIQRGALDIPKDSNKKKGSSFSWEIWNRIDSAIPTSVQPAGN